MLVAFSGGVDSTLLLAAAARRLGPLRVRAVTVLSPSLARAERDETRALAAEIGVQLIVVEGREMSNPDYLRNAPDRCYFCKSDLVERMVEVSEKTEFTGLCYGAITDDLGDDRPGMKAAREGGLHAPLLAAGFSKIHVRALSRHWRLRTWDKPAMACLSSRIPTGTEITPGLLDRVDRAEQVLLSHGFRLVRVRSHGELARLELDPEGVARLSRDPQLMAEIASGIRETGFRHVALDPDGYRQGSLNLAFRAR